MPFFSCTVNEIGPAADGTETADPVIYINLTDTGGSFANQWFHAAENGKGQMLSVGLAAMSTNRQVEVAINTPNVPYSSVTRMYLLGSEFGGGTKVVLNQSFDDMPTSGKKCRFYRHQRLRKDPIFGNRQWIGQHPVLSPFRLGRSIL
jgi:hypothetical protein